MSPDLAADSTVSLAAVAGLTLTLRRITSDDPLASRFRFCLAVMGALMLVRVGYWSTGFWPLRMATVILAGLMPLSALLLTEGMLRRHAPGWLKAGVVAGVGAITLLAFLPEARVEPGRMLVMLGFQAGVLSCLGIWVFRRDRASLTPTENRTIDHMALSFLLILPLLATDYRNALMDPAVRLGGIALLGLCWLSLGAARAGPGVRAILWGFAGMVVLAAAVTGAVSAITPLPPRAQLQVGAVVLAGLLVLAIAVEGAALRAGSRSSAVLARLGAAPLTDVRQFLGDLAAHSETGAAAVLTPEDLGDFDLPELTRLLTQTPVRARTDLSALPEGDRDQMRWLYERFEATHVLMITPRPLTLVVLNRPGFAGSDVTMLELCAVQRMAALLAQAQAR